MNTKKNVMVLGRIVIFVLIFCCFFLFLETVFWDDRAIHPTWEYIANGKAEPIDILYIGNSHMYCTLDAEVLSMATGKNIRCLTCASINGKVVCADLEAFLHYQVPKVVVLEMCPFSINDNTESTMGLVYEHFDGIPELSVKAEAVSNTFDFENVPAGIFQLLRSTNMWTRLKNDGIKKDYGYDSYGSNKKWQVYYDDKYDPQQLQITWNEYNAEQGMPDYNREAFEKIIALSENYGFDIWILNSPISYFDPCYANAIFEIQRLQKEYSSVRHIDNMMLHLDEIGIDKTDFYDSGHLNPNGMEKATCWMLDRIGERLNVSTDLGQIPRYKSTRITMLENQIYKYEVNTYKKDVLYSFVYTNSDGKSITSEYSAQNWIEEKMILDMNRFYVRIKENENAEEITYRFVPYTIERYTIGMENNMLYLKNDANFSDDLSFAWYIINLDSKEIEKHMYTDKPELQIEFDQSGTYMIEAFTRVEDSGLIRLSDIMTVDFDENCNEISVEDMQDTVVIDYK